MKVIEKVKAMRWPERILHIIKYGFILCLIIQITLYALILLANSSGIAIAICSINFIGCTIGIAYTLACIFKIDSCSMYRKLILRALAGGSIFLQIGAIVFIIVAYFSPSQLCFVTN